MLYFEELLLNLFMLLITLFLYHNWIERAQKNINLEILNWETAIFPSIAIILCMTFPAYTAEGLFVDFRHIPLWIGTLYGGPVAGIIVGAVTILYRFILGGEGLLPTFIVTILVMVVGGLFYKRFIKLAVKKRIYTIMSLVLSSGLLAVLIGWFLGAPNANIVIWIYAFVFQPLVAVIVVYFLEKINQQIFLRRELYQNEKDKLVTHLAACISHEVRNPLTTSKGFLQLISKDVECPKLKEFSNLALDELKRAEKIINDYLTFAKPDTSQLTVINVSHEVTKAISVISPLASMNNVQIQFAANANIHISGNQQQFQQSLVNLFKNAIEAMKSGGLLLIQVVDETNQVLLVIEDTGCGMTKEQIKRLGEPYFSTKGSNGTGLGMMVTYKIIKAMGGEIKVDSTVGEGTQFKIMIPSKVDTAEVASAYEI